MGNATVPVRFRASGYPSQYEGNMRKLIVLVFLVCSCYGEDAMKIARQDAHQQGYNECTSNIREQFVKKCRNGAAAYAATDLDEGVGAHWRMYGSILDEAGEEGLRSAIWDQWFFDPPVRLIADPVPYSG